MTEEQKGMLASTLGYIIFGFSYLFSKKALGVTEPMLLLAARFTVTFVVLNLLLLTRLVRIRLRGKKLAGPILLGILQPVLYFIFENYGLKYTTTSFTGMISSVSPIFVAVLGALLLREIPNWKQWIGIVISIAGVAMVSVGTGGGVNTPFGCLCLILAYLFGALYTLLARKLTKEFTPFELTYVMFVVGFLFFAALAFVQYRGETIPMLASACTDSGFLIAVLYLGVAASIGAYSLTTYGIARLPVARASVFGNVATIVSVASGVLLMHDPFSLVSALAFALILCGIWMVNRFQSEKAPEKG